MSSDAIAIVLSLSLLLFFLVIKVPIFMSLLLAGMVGFQYLEGFDGSANLLGRLAFNQLLGYPLLAMPMFILMGNLLNTHKVGSQLFDALNKTFGHLPGGLAVASTVVCAIFGFMSGSNTAAAATIGEVAIPEMEKKGYYRPLTLGTLAVAGTLAALIPPSTIMIIYGTAVTEVSIGKVFVGGIIPGLILTALMSVYIIIYALIYPNRAPRGERTTLGVKLSGLTQLAPAVLIFVTIIGGMFLGYFTAIEASAMSVVITLAYLIFTRLFKIRYFGMAVIRTVKISGMIYMIIIGATILSHFFFITGFQDTISNFILGMNLSPYMTMVMILIILTILGTFLDVIALIMISVPIFLPVALYNGFDGVWFGVIMVIASEMALCTPPVGVNLFVIHGISPVGTKLTTVAKGTFPFIGVIWILLLILIAYPELVTWLPNHMRY